MRIIKAAEQQENNLVMCHCENNEYGTGMSCPNHNWNE